MGTKNENASSNIGYYKKKNKQTKKPSGRNCNLCMHETKLTSK